MKKICILGWYGTETLGDRAILDGIFQIFNSFGEKIKFSIGSLHPEFTERTFLEDGEIYKSNSQNCSFDIFDVYNKHDYKKSIEDSDIIIMGGGPIMDLRELSIISYGFSYAKSNHKKTVIMGCGMGPLKNNKNIKIVKKILKKSDISIFRDKESCDFANSIYKGNNYYSYDPAIFSVLFYKKMKHISNEKYRNSICINFREVSSDYYMINNLEKVFTEIIENVSISYEKVFLVPMHTYAIGGDDRKVLAKIDLLTKKQNVQVIHKPMNLYELYEAYMNSNCCIGTRYHSIVMQTLLNGNNIIIDYTNKKNGKIISFLNMIDKDNFYSKRYMNLQNIPEDISSILSNLKSSSKFQYDINIYETGIKFYHDRLEVLFNEKK